MSGPVSQVAGEGVAHTPGGAAPRTARQIARDLRDSGMGCNCDLDRWEPEAITGHSCVCRIHKAALDQYRAALRLAQPADTGGAK